MILIHSRSNNAARRGVERRGEEWRGEEERKKREKWRKKRGAPKRACAAKEQRETFSATENEKAARVLV